MIRFVPACFVAWCLMGILRANDFRAELKPLLEAHCLDCHSGEAAEGGLRIDRLEGDLGDAAVFASWERIYDRVRLAEMPPQDAEPMSPAERERFRKTLHSPLHLAHDRQKGTVLRRLNRGEYQNTMNDLFGTHLDLASLLPEDGRSHEFDNVGAALNLSMVQLQQYLAAADAVIDSAIAKTADPPQPETKHANYAETREGETHIGKTWKKLDDGAVVFFKAFGYPSGMLRTANVRKPGRYRIRVTGYAYQSEKPITFAIGATTFQRGAERPTFAYRAMPPGDPTTVEIEAWIEDKYMIELTPWGINDHDNEIRKHGPEDYAGPGLAILDVELHGPLVASFPSAGHQLLLAGLERRIVEPSNPALKKKPWYVPQFEIDSDDPRRDAATALQRVARTAFRRPVDVAEVEPYVELFADELAGGASFEAALRTAAAAVFCSPDFLFLRERTDASGRLDDFALANRLSYFLTRTSPDRSLVAAATAGKLTRDTEELQRQTRRLLNDPRNARFVVDFTDAWLNLRDIEFTNPDQGLFPEFDPFLQFSMLQETRQFLATLIEENRPVSDLIQPGFAMLNNRLAQHYGIPDVEGPEIRRVAVPADSVRGGLLGQASVLKVSANGTNTSPVVRGVWVMERILGSTPPPPPPGIPGVEPDVRGATTLRELLEKHRDSANCRSCHAVIDPPGFALESFNPIGGWRDRFRSLGEGERTDRRVAGRKVRYRLGQEVDASGRLPDGEAFDGFLEFRRLLVRDQDRLAKAFVEKLLTFATGREMGFSDRDAIDEMVQQSKQRGQGVRDLLELLVTSDLFCRK